MTYMISTGRPSGGTILRPDGEPIATSVTMERELPVLSTCTPAVAMVHHLVAESYVEPNIGV